MGLARELLPQDLHSARFRAIDRTVRGQLERAHDRYGHLDRIRLHADLRHLDLQRLVAEFRALDSDRLASGRRDAAFHGFHLEFRDHDWARVAADLGRLHRLDAGLGNIHVQPADLGLEQGAGLILDAGLAQLAPLLGQADLGLLDQLFLVADLGQLAGTDLQDGSLNGGALWDALGLGDSDGGRAGSVYVLVPLAKAYLRDLYGRRHRAVLQRRRHFLFGWHCDTGPGAGDRNESLCSDLSEVTCIFHFPRKFWLGP